MTRGDLKNHRCPVGVSPGETTRGAHQSQPAVVIHINGSSCGDVTTGVAQHLSGSLCGTGGAAGAAGRYDPHKIHREFPGRWQAYILAHYQSLAHVCWVFDVCESTARKWWTGETGANGANVAIAINVHPVEAHEMLFARAA